MKYLLWIALLGGAVHAQGCAAGGYALPDAPSPHPFWTVEKRLEIGILAGLVAADGITTQRGLNQGLREINPVMRPLVTRGAAGQAVGPALGFGAGIGIVYVLHRSYHYKAERIAMRLIVGSEAGFVANNIVAIWLTRLRSSAIPPARIANS